MVCYCSCSGKINQHFVWCFLFVGFRISLGIVDFIDFIPLLLPLKGALKCVSHASVCACECVCVSIVWHASKFKFATKIEFDEPSSTFGVCCARLCVFHLLLFGVCASIWNRCQPRRKQKRKTKTLAKNPKTLPKMR